MKSITGRRVLAALIAAATLGSVAAVGSSTAIAQDGVMKGNGASGNPSIIINEVFAGNTKEAGDPIETRDDWVELKNTGETSVDVKGWGHLRRKAEEAFHHWG